MKPNKQNTFFENAKSSLSAPVFTVDLKKGSPGTYSFGFIDNTKYTGKLAYVPVDSSKGFWGFTASGYAVADGGFKSTDIEAIVDTGTTLLYLPDNVVDDYYDRVSSASYNNDQGGYTFPCGTTLPSITLTIGSYSAVVPGPFIQYAPIDKASQSEFAGIEMPKQGSWVCTDVICLLACFGGIQSNTGIGFSILGDIFLKSQFVVFDGSDSPRLGFAAKPL